MATVRQSKSSRPAAVRSTLYPEHWDSICLRRASIEASISIESLDWSIIQWFEIWWSGEDEDEDEDCKERWGGRMSRIGDSFDGGLSGRVEFSRVLGWIDVVGEWWLLELRLRLIGKFARFVLIWRFSWKLWEFRKWVEWLEDFWWSLEGFFFRLEFDLWAFHFRELFLVGVFLEMCSLKIGILFME